MGCAHLSTNGCYERKIAVAGFYKALQGQLHVINALSDMMLTDIPPPFFVLLGLCPPSSQPGAVLVLPLHCPTVPLAFFSQSSSHHVLQDHHRHSPSPRFRCASHPCRETRWCAREVKALSKPTHTSTADTTTVNEEQFVSMVQSAISASTCFEIHTLPVFAC